MSIDIERIRELAAVEAGRLAVEERFGSVKLSAVDSILLQKMSNADTELMKVAMSLRPGSLVAAYGNLGGAFKAEE